MVSHDYFIFICLDSRACYGIECKYWNVYGIFRPSRNQSNRWLLPHKSLDNCTCDLWHSWVNFRRTCICCNNYDSICWMARILSWNRYIFRSDRNSRIFSNKRASSFKLYIQSPRRVISLDKLGPTRNRIKVILKYFLSALHQMESLGKLFQIFWLHCYG